MLRISLLELLASEIAAQINALQISSNRCISTSTEMFRGDFMNQTFMVELLLPLLKDINKKKRHAWTKKHKQWTWDRWKSFIWNDESKFKNVGSNRREFVRHRVGERMISACVVPTVKHEGGVMVLYWWHCDLFRIQGTHNQHGYHSILQRYTIPSG